ncbi:hypothetical protein EVAR_7584_1 [Eumeta japonica]|uniref:Uncharacterized protein n=1 Tax=Eumeta variegata TaxID=151549 RepID=A0A4C2A5Z0_EUMVA|nr:hypothetical protein EVAR_7584_1 [Eumeta japonica]
MDEGAGQECFPQLYKYATSNELVVSQDLMALFTEHLTKLIEWFSKCFSDDDVENLHGSKILSMDKLHQLSNHKRQRSTPPRGGRICRPVLSAGVFNHPSSAFPGCFPADKREKDAASGTRCGAALVPFVERELSC